MIIEMLKKEDLESYLKLINENFDADDQIERYEQEFNENVHIVVAKKNNEIISSITFVTIELFTFKNQPSIMLFNVVTDKKYRKKGIAKMLFQYIKEYAKENGYKSISLTCLESEKNVHKFYESCGMTKAESRKYVINL